MRVLEALLRPAGAGVHLVSTGREAQEALQRRLYGVGHIDEVRAVHRASLARIADARVVLLAVPSDVGAGFRRGSNLGPQAIREALVDAGDHAELFASHGVLDLGDVLAVPQLLSDDMLSAAQIEASRRAIYGDSSVSWPVAPLSIAERVLDAVLAINPRAVPFVLGGDHSVAWPVVAALHRVRPRLGIVQIDAHTDLLAERLGVRMCFATWTYHANELLGRGGRVVQVGIRASGRDRAHWEGTCDVRQLWARDFLADPSAALEQIVAWVRASGVEEIYVSNDIDGTDARWADATGTPEPGGLEPEHVERLFARLAEIVRIGAADVVEVAPPLSATRTTVDLAARYVRATLSAIEASSQRA
ncbi:MAG: arginase family protein [Sandaracinaceae bacterium]|nr:arginase family protein [Sandaracinaceae bacterium]